MANLTVPNVAANDDVQAAPLVTAPEAPAAPDVAQAAPVSAPVQEVVDADTQADEAVKAVIGGDMGPPKPTMQSSVALAIGTNPDAEAEARRVALRTGVPVETVFAKPEEMKRKAALDDINFSTYEKLYPASALALTDTELAKIAHDDTENMGYTENVLRGIGQRTVNLGGGFLRFTGTLAQDVARKTDDYVPTVLELYPDFGLRHMTAEERASATGIDPLVKGMENFNLGYQPRTTWEDVKSRPLSEFLPFALEQGLVSVPDMAAAVYNAPAYFSALTGDMAQNRAQNDERTEATVEDFIKVAPAAAATALLERFATKGIIGADDAITAFKQIPKAVGVAALKEGSTEAVQNAAQYASETAGTKKGFSWGELGEQALQGAVAGGPFGGAVRGTTGTVQASVQRARNRTEQAAIAEQNARDFEQLNALAAESKLKQRDPLAFQNFIEQVAESDGTVENVYVDPRALAQSGISLEALAESSPSIADQVRVAIETGGDVKIPVSEYATHLAGTELGQAMIDHLKTNPLGMSRAEAKEFMQSSMDMLRAEVEKSIADSQVDDTAQKSADTVRDNLLGQLTKANRFTKDVNDQYATLLSNFYKVQAGRLGMTPEEFYAAHPVNIQSTYDPGQTLSLNQFAGVEAEVANIPNLEDAQQRIAQGEDKEKVRKATGWFEGVDGKWRFEISDKDAKIKKITTPRGNIDAFPIHKAGEYKLSDIIDHPRLFQAYPGLKDFKIRISEGAGDINGAYSPKTETIIMGARPQYDGKKQFLSTLLHEIQHVIQEIEGFAKGGDSTEFLKKYVDAANEDLKDIQKLNTGLRDISRQLDEARANKDVATTERLTEAYDRTIAARNRLSERAAGVDMVTMRADAYEQYRRLAGEMEARNTQARQDLDDEDRINISPEETQDIASENAVVVLGNGIEVTAPKSLLNQGEMAARGSFNPETNTITLLRNADLSTFLHESGHFFLETMNKLALSENAPDAIKADMQAVFDWLGVKDIAEWNSHDLEWQREKHEQFARGFEAYLFEGKSPSVEMRSVFQRFRAWMLNVYRQLSALNVELSDEVRGVFDRMLATEEQVKETEIARSFEPMFSDLRAAGMSPEEWQQYQEIGLKATQEAVTNLEARSMRDMKFMSNARSRALKDLQREAAGRRREVRDQVTKEVMSEPVNQAREFITKGKFELPENANSELKRLATETGLGSTKLSLPALKEMYGEEANAPWRYFTTGKNGEAGTEGLHPDVLADMFGFTSGDELVRALLEAENPKERIAALTDQRMLEKYGDLTNPDVMAQAADEAVHNEVRARFIATEMNALQRATGGRKVMAEAAKRFAEGMIDRLRIRDIQPGRYSAAETRAAKAAAESFKAGGLVAAAVEKRNQLIQHYAARAAHAGLREAEKAVQYFKKFDREGSRENIATSNLDQIDKLLERFDLRKSQSLKEIDKRATLAKWVAEQEELGIEPEIPPELLNEAARKHYKDMTLEEIRGLRDTIKQLEHLGRLKNKLLTAKDNREFKAIVDSMVASINANANGRVVDNRTRATRKDQAIRLFKGFVASHRKVASLARELDGFKDGGPVWETLIRTMNEAGDKEATMRAKATKDIAKLIKPMLADGKMGGKGQFFPTIQKSLNREERIGIALNMGNAGNVQRLLDGEGWTLDQVRPVLETLTKKDWDFVQSIWDYFETFRPEIGAKEKRIYGKEPAWVEPNPVATKFGEYRGGYYPVKYDTRQSIAAEQHSDAEFAKQQMRGAYTSATTRRSFTKTRAEEVKGRPLLYSMDGLYNGLNEVIHDLSWHEWLIDANRLLRNKALDGAIRTGYGADVTQQFKTAVRDIAGGEMPNGTAFEKGIADLRAGTMIAGLGFNIVNAAINTTGITNSIVRIGPRWVAQGIGKFSQNPRALLREVHGKSDFMRLRSKTMLRELNEIQSQVRGKSRTRAVMDDLMFAPMTMTQIAVDTPVWWGAYQKALTEGNAEDRAIALADQAVLDSQSGGQVKDLAAIQRGPALMKLFTTFYGYFNAVYNLGVEKTKATNFKDPASVLKLGGDYLMLYTVPVVLGTLIKNALMGTEDDWEPEKLAKTLVNEQLSYLMGQMVGLREVTGAVQTVAGTNPYAAGYSGPAGLRFFDELFNLATQIHQGEGDEALRKSVVNVLGIFFKLPASQINRTIGGIEALIDGETGNPAAVVAGPPKK